MPIFSFFPAALAVFSVFLRLVAADTTCNPLNGPCPAIPGLSTSTYFIDFTQQSTTPSDWILADSATVGYGAPNGANFTFAKRYDAPYIWSRFYVLFGRIEVVLKAAPGAGIITGAVMMSDDLDEIDWEWSGNNFGGSNGEVQTNYFGRGQTGYYDRGTLPAVDSPQNKFHTYALDWSPTALTWSIDGKNVRTLKNSGSASGSYQYPQTPSRLHLGLWCSGDPDSNPATVSWGGGYTNFSAAPFTAFVKSVKITTSNPCSSWQYPSPFDGTYKNVKCTNQTVTLPCMYTVVAGDDGSKIAKNLTVNLDTLKSVNPGVNWDVLFVGQTLNVPGGTCTTPSTTTMSTPPATASTTSNTTTLTTSLIASTTTSSSPTTSGSSIGSSSSTKISPMSTQVSSTTTTTTSISTQVSSIMTTSTMAASSSTLTPAVSTTSSGMNSTSSTGSDAGSTTTSSGSAQSTSSYTVMSGDYGYAIAEKLGCSFSDLEAANPGIDWDKLLIGQTLNVPGSATVSSLPTVASAPGSSSFAGTSPTGTSASSSPLTSSSSSASPASSPAPICSASPSSCPTDTSDSDGGYTTSASNTVSTLGSSTSSAASSTVASTWGSLSGIYQVPTSTTVTVGATTTTSSYQASSSWPSSTGSSMTPGTTSPPAQTTSSPNKITPTTAAPVTKMNCNQDNCLRNVIDPRYSSSMHSFCPAYTTVTSNPTPLPSFLTGCSQDVKRVSSACSCLMTSSPTGTATSGTPAMAGPVMRAGTPSWKRTPAWRLKRSPVRWDRPAL